MKKLTFWNWVALGCLGAFFYYVLGPGARFHQPRSQGLLTACKSNEKNIGTALDMYASDHQGKLPGSLSQLTPNYLTRIPTCPAAGEDTYSAHYASAGQNYTFWCSGQHHEAAAIRADRPAYNSRTGLITE